MNSTKASGSAGPLLADPLFFCPHGDFAEIIPHDVILQM